MNESEQTDWAPALWCIHLVDDASLGVILKESFDESCGGTIW